MYQAATTLPFADDLKSHALLVKLGMAYGFRFTTSMSVDHVKFDEYIGCEML